MVALLGSVASVDRFSPALALSIKFPMLSNTPALADRGITAIISNRKNRPKDGRISCFFVADKPFRFVLSVLLGVVWIGCFTDSPPIIQLKAEFSVA